MDDKERDKLETDRMKLGVMIDREETIIVNYLSGILTYHKSLGDHYVELGSLNERLES